MSIHTASSPFGMPRGTAMDSSAICNLMSNEMVFIGEGTIEKNMDSLVQNFIEPNSKK